MLQEIQVRGGVKKRPHPSGGGGGVWIFSGITHFRPKGYWFFCPVSCVFLLHMGLEITTLQIWQNLENLSKQLVINGLNSPRYLGVLLKDSGVSWSPINSH